MEQDVKVNKPFLQKVADRLISVQGEIDELVLQFALGKAEAKEKFEEVKKELRSKISEFKKLVENSGGGIVTPELRQKLDELELQLALGMADTADAFEKQRKLIIKTLNSTESALKSWLSTVKVPTHVHHDIETFKLKLEIIRLRFQLKKFEITDAFKNQMGKA